MTDMKSKAGVRAFLLRIRKWGLATGWSVASLFLILIFFLLIAQVSLRTLFDESVFWFDELARYSYVWMAFIAAVIVFANDSHIRVEIINRDTRPRLSSVLDALGYLTAAIILFALVIDSYDWLQRNIRPRSSALRMPLVYFYGVVWVCYAFMASIAAVFLALALRKLWRSRKGSG